MSCNESGTEVSSCLMSDGAKQIRHRQTVFCKSHAVYVKIKFRIILFIIREFRVYRHFLDASEIQQCVGKFACPCRQLIIIISPHLNPVTSGSLPDIIIEPLVFKTVYAPASASQSQGFRHHIRLESVRIFPLIFRFEIYGNRCPARSRHICLELAYPLLTAQECLHLRNQDIHLRQCGPIG